MVEYCPCDLCNGRLTGAWEDEVENWYDYNADSFVYADYYEDPYAGLCQACGETLSEEVIHTMETCSAPWFWSAYAYEDREEKIREYFDQSK